MDLILRPQNFVAIDLDIRIDLHVDVATVV